MNGGEEEVVAGLQNLELQAGRHRRLQLLVEFIDAGVHLRSVGAGSLEHHVDGARLSIDVRREVVAHGTNLHLGDIAQMQQMAAFAGAQHDVIELLNGLQRALVLHGVLIGILTLLAQRTRCRDEALSADSGEHIVGLQTILRHHVGLQPDAQRIGVAEGHHVAHAGDTHQTGTNVDVNVVGDEVGVILAVDALQRADVQDVALLLHHLHTHLRHLRGQQGGSTAHAVLHIHGSEVGVGALLEVDLNGDIARGRCRTGDVGHARHTVDILLQRLHHRFHNRVGISTCVGGGHAHRRRCNVWILLDGQRAHADYTHQRDDNRYGACHHISINENVSLHGLLLVFRYLGEQHPFAFLHVIGTDGHNLLADVQAALHDEILTVASVLNGDGDGSRRAVALHLIDQ